MSEHGRGPGPILRSCKSRKTILSGTFAYDYANGMGKLVAELESQSLEIRTSEGAKMLKSKVHEAMTEAESNTAPCVIIDRLDLLMFALTESSRENVCTNTMCPHYDKKCRMR